jgi:hypothetical protein
MIYQYKLSNLRCKKRSYIKPPRITHRHCKYKRYINEHWPDYCWSAKTISITHSECVTIDLITQRAQRMHHITRVLPCVPV